jgi:hypothetical protein
LLHWIHAYDQQNFIKLLEPAIDRLSTLAPKLRCKPCETHGIISQCYTGLQVLLEQFSDLHDLSIDARRTLTGRNMSTIGAFQGIYLCDRFGPEHRMNFFNAYVTFYGWKFANDCLRLVRGCNLDGNPFKITLLVLIFSENYSIVREKNQPTTDMKCHTINLTSIQNVYATILWLTSFIKLVLDTIRGLDLVLPDVDLHEQIE